MIFVTVGTNEARFDRLLREVARLRLDERLVIQHGHSAPLGPPGAQLVAFLPFDDMVATMREARVVVTHAGVGSVMVALANGRRPIVVPRLSSFGEAVDDHQLQLARRFARAGLVTPIESPVSLAEALASRSPSEQVSIAPAADSLAADLRSFLADVVGRPPRPLDA